LNPRPRTRQTALTPQNAVFSTGAAFNMMADSHLVFNVLTTGDARSRQRAAQRQMSVLPLKADMCIAILMSAMDQNRTSYLLDDLVSTSKQRNWHCDAQRFGGLHIDRHLEFGWRLHWHVGWFLALQDAIDVACCPPI